MEEAPLVPEEHRKWAVACHLAAVAGFFMPWVGMGLGPLIAWLVLRREHPTVDAHGREAIQFNVSIMIWTAIGWVFACVLGPLFWIFSGALVVLWFVCVVIASLKAGEGRLYRYPITVRFLKQGA